MTSGEIIAIGTELLLGEIQDTNIRYIARAFRALGIDMYRATIVGDNASRIAQAVREALERSEVVITTGGLGPTVDDPTREAIAQALGVPLEFRPELWHQIEERYRRYGRHPGENARRQAYIPQGATAVENPVGTAPAFYCEVGNRVVISLPGVPRELEFLMEVSIIPYLKKRFGAQGVIKTLVLRTAGLPESQIDELLGEFERLSNPTVGLSAHPGSVDVRITAKAATEEEADRVLQETADQIRPLLKEAVYGINDETLAGVVVRLLHERAWQLSLLECGTEGHIQRTLREAGLNSLNATSIEQPCSYETLVALMDTMRREHPTEVTLAVDLKSEPWQSELQLRLFLFDKIYEDRRLFGGPPSNRFLWATNSALDFLRRLLSNPT